MIIIIYLPKTRNYIKDNLVRSYYLNLINKLIIFLKILKELIKLKHRVI